MRSMSTTPVNMQAENIQLGNINTATNDNDNLSGERQSQVEIASSVASSVDNVFDNINNVDVDATPGKGEGDDQLYEPVVMEGVVQTVETVEIGDNTCTDGIGNNTGKINNNLNNENIKNDKENLFENSENETSSSEELYAVHQVSPKGDNLENHDQTKR